MIYSLKRAKIAHLKVDEVFTKVFGKYVDFVDNFSRKLAVELLEHIKINNYAIELIDNGKFSYNFIYSLRPMKLKILKTYIANNLANNFIRLFQFSVKTLIFFDKKLNGSLRLHIDYENLNNLIIKNRYLLSLVSKLLDQLGQA